MTEEEKSSKPDGVDGFLLSIGEVLRSVPNPLKRLVIQGKLSSYLYELLIENE